jgi:RNA polymerase sigma factor (sigma-70 family)
VTGRNAVRGDQHARRRLERSRTHAGHGAGPLTEAALDPASASARTAEQGITTIYAAHYRSLARLTTLLVGDVATAETVVQDSFIAMHGAWRQLRDCDEAVAYLRQCVVSRSRSVLDQQMRADRETAGGAAPASDAGRPDAGRPDAGRPDAGRPAAAALTGAAMIATLRTLPPRQREALVLSFYLDLPPEQVAAAMGISRAAAESHTARAMQALRRVTELGT